MLHSGLKLGGRYRLDARIGAGGMGEVWRAFDEVLGRVVAVKAMLPEVADQPDFARRFLVEAKSMASVNHAAVASIHDFGRSDGITFLVMEFIDGESLSQALGRAGRLGAADTMRLVAQAADGLQAVHDRGIVHRDIKPANLLVRRDGSLLITDFGISRTQDGTHLTVSGAILGTPTYLSPEQVLGRPATGLSDVYSLGLAAYECLAGQRPFSGENPYAVALQRLQAGPPPLGGDVPRPVAQVIERALAIEPADRWGSAAEFAAAARAALHGPAGQPSPPAGWSPPPQPQSWSRTPPPAHQPWPPAAAAPGSVAPGYATPSSGAPGSGARGYATPGSGAAGYATPGSGAPGYATPGSGAPGYATPGSGAAGYATPGSGAGGFGASASGSAVVAPAVDRPAVGQPAVDRPAAAPGRRPARRLVVVALLLVTVVVGGVTVWQIFGKAAPNPGPADASGPRASTAAETPGFAPCGPVLCPVEPLCWGGLTASSGKAAPPWPTDCAQTHVWETFAAIPLPASAARTREDELIQNSAVAAACLPALMTSRSRDRSATAEWVSEAWPIQVGGAGPRLIHCLAQPQGENRERKGAAFRS